MKLNEVSRRTGCILARAGNRHRVRRAFDGGRRVAAPWTGISPPLRAIGLVLTLPGVLYGDMTGRDVFVSPLSMSVYFLAQMGFYAVVVFLFTAVVRFFQAPPRKKAGW